MIGFHPVGIAGTVIVNQVGLGEAGDAIAGKIFRDRSGEGNAIARSEQPGCRQLEAGEKRWTPAIFTYKRRS